MSRPRLLDLFCGAGGAAVGYHRAGFEVVGVDNRPQPHYPFEFWQQDAFEVLAGTPINRHDGQGARSLDLGQFDAIHASPPCQAYSAGGNIWRSRLGPAIDRHPDLIGPTRERLIDAGVPYVIENVERAASWMVSPYTLCGRAFGLGVKRHRLFETTFGMLVPPCPSGHPGDWISVFGGGSLSRTPKGGQSRINGRHNGRGANDGRIHVSHERSKAAMDIDWMTREELSQAIPPAYTEHIAFYLAAAIETARAAA